MQLRMRPRTRLLIKPRPRRTRVGWSIRVRVLTALMIGWIFENLTPWIRKLTTAGGSLRIVGRGDAIITLPNSSTAKLGDVLFAPGIGTNPLSTQALLAQRIENHNLVHEVEFNRAGERGVVAKGSHEGLVSQQTPCHPWPPNRYNAPTWSYSRHIDR